MFTVRATGDQQELPASAGLVLLVLTALPSEEEPCSLTMGRNRDYRQLFLTYCSRDDMQMSAKMIA